ncbi:unnamed protein product [Caenorhabditis angaria]|uniref:Uncharacterized protein n=1 Tax=Caenorhabditis angaria TaxID=860376 RepID=A0A9P1MZI1_9PELO|nr:unnamed protein product [Caenorhabditis angaria]
METLIFAKIKKVFGFPECDTEHIVEEKKKKNCFKSSLFELIKYSSKTEFLYISISLVCALVGGAIQPIVLLIGGWITNLYLVNSSNVGDEKFLHDVIKLIYTGIGCGIIIFILALIQGICIQRGTRRIIDKIRKDYLSAVLRQDANWLDNHPAGTINCQLNENTEIINDGLGIKCCLLVRGFAMFASSIIACAFIQWQLTFITFTMGPLSAFVLHYLTKVTESTNEEMMNLSAKSHTIFEESILNVRTIQTCNGQNFMIKKLKQVNILLKNLQNKITFWTGFFDGLSLFTGYFITGIALFFGCRLYFEGDINKKGDVILIVNTVCVTGYFLGLLGPHLSSLQQAASSFQLLHDVILSAPLKEGKEGELKIKSTSGHIVFKNVHFKYATRDKKVLQGLSFEVLPGQTVALVGTSGCGKSTSIGLLTKMYRANEGEILLDGQNIDLIDAKSLRQQIGIVEQEPKLFDGTIVENIRLGRDVTNEMIQNATDIANASDFINSLEKGYQTRIGSGSVQLSGGQKQRICISRALVSAPSILLLDEATSALDSHNEHIVNKALQNASIGRTTLIIAHRLSSLKNVDKIYVLDDGQVKEIGKHDELIELGGIYAKLARSQEIEQSSIKDYEREEQKRNEKIKKLKSNEFQTIPIVNRHDVEVNMLGPVNTETTIDEKITLSGLGKLIRLVPKHPKMLALIILLTIPRSFELCAYGLGLSFAFNTLEYSKDEYMTWAYITLAEQTLTGLFVWTIHTALMYTCGWLANEIMDDVKETILCELLHKPIAYFDSSNTSPSACVSKIINHTTNSYACLDHRAIRFVWFVIGTVFSLLLAFPFVWELGCVGLFITILLTVFTFYFVSVAHDANSEKAAKDKSGQFGTEIVEQIRAIKLISAEDYFEKQFQHFVEKAEQYDNKIGFISALNFAITQSYVFASDMLLFYIGTLLIFKGKYLPNRIFMAFNGAQMSAWGVMYFSAWIPEIVRGSASANQIFSFFENSPKSRKLSGASKPQVEGDVQLRNIIFSYPSRPQKVVCNNLNIRAPKGKSIALVGPSGCGKSTVFAMLERFYSNSSGKITIDDTDITDIDVHHLRENIAVVGQEPILFNATIYENITLGLENISIDEVQKACVLANAASFIENFPNGYDTIVGEGGGALSGGQKQRIAIARAIIRKPKILLLDEATSALDTQSEKIVQKALRSATEGRTSIFIAHRLSTVQHCDIIYYISKGSVAEFGTHYELMNLNRKYARLVASQSLV